MRYMCLWRPARHNDPGKTNFAEMMKFIEETTKSGQLVSTGGWMPDAPGATIRSEGGKLTVTDGPYTEAKEMIGGYAILEVRSKDEAIELARRFVRIAGDGISELRELGAPPPK
ncbi:MAG TPA: YciI family protein [Kofleriaceae bacterium]|nr:YciI family protein [Kofleriaceae bacterium]